MMGTDVKIERKSSIEREPRTLSLKQIQYARQEALYVLNTNTAEEALSIFTEGLQTVPTISDGRIEADDPDLFDHFGELWSFPALKGLRDIDSAPF